MVLVDNQPNLPSDLVREASVPPSQVPTTSAEWQNLGKLVQLLRTSSFAETLEMGIGFYPYIDFCLWPFLEEVCMHMYIHHVHAKHVSQSPREEG